MKHSFTITDKAASKLFELCSGEGSKFRVAVDGGGCSGFQYHYSFVHVIEEDEVVFFNKNGIDVLVDSSSLKLLDGSVLDYQENLGGAGFEIINPKAKMRCGCGNSFSI